MNMMWVLQLPQFVSPLVLDSVSDYIESILFSISYLRLIITDEWWWTDLIYFGSLTLQACLFYEVESPRDGSLQLFSLSLYAILIIVTVFLLMFLVAVLCCRSGCCRRKPAPDTGHFPRDSNEKQERWGPIVKSNLPVSTDPYFESFRTRSSDYGLNYSGFPSPPAASPSISQVGNKKKKTLSTESSSAKTADQSGDNEPKAPLSQQALSPSPKDQSRSEDPENSQKPPALDNKNPFMDDDQVTAL